MPRNQDAYTVCRESVGPFIPCTDTATQTLVFTPQNRPERYCDEHAAWTLRRFPHCYRPLIQREG
jgi:hypothetical protein